MFVIQINQFFSSFFGVFVFITSFKQNLLFGRLVLDDLFRKIDQVKEKRRRIKVKNHV